VHAGAAEVIVVNQAHVLDPHAPAREQLHQPGDQDLLATDGLSTSG
jgi:hypothetical protein